MDPLSKTAHRPWPPPSRPWLMKQIWRDLLFAHWPMPVSALRPLVPMELPLDTFDDCAWLTIAPFHMEIRPRGLPTVPGMRRIPELNCRTYVTLDGKPGVFFLSLDISSRAAVWTARTFYHLPYFHAEMSVKRSGETVSYSSRRGSAAWRCTYSPASGAQHASPHSIGHFLTERYCLYAVQDGRVYRGDIHHLPWPLQQAHAEIQENTIAQAAGIPLQGPPAIVSFTRELEVLVWWPQAIAG